MIVFNHVKKKLIVRSIFEDRNQLFSVTSFGSMREVELGIKFRVNNFYCDPNCFLCMVNSTGFSVLLKVSFGN